MSSGGLSSVHVQRESSLVFLFLQGHQSWWIRTLSLWAYLTLITSLKAPPPNLGPPHVNLGNGNSVYNSYLWSFRIIYIVFYFTASIECEVFSFIIRKSNNVPYLCILMFVCYLFIIPLSHCLSRPKTIHFLVLLLDAISLLAFSAHWIMTVWSLPSCITWVYVLVCSRAGLCPLFVSSELSVMTWI